MLKFPTFLLPLVTMFAKPLGNLIAQALTGGSVAFITWSVSHGMDQGTATTIAAGAVGAVGALVQWAASTQGVSVKVINDDTTNGLRVVTSNDAKVAGIPKVDPTAPKA